MDDKHISFRSRLCFPISTLHFHIQNGLSSILKNLLKEDEKEKKNHKCTWWQGVEEDRHMVDIVNSTKGVDLEDDK